MAEQTNHPSFLELDRLALNAQKDPTTADHVRGCAQCKGYLDQLSTDRPVPRWAKDLSTQGAKAHAGHRSRWRWGGALAGATASLAAILILVVIPDQESPQITAKGDPAVGVYIKRHDRVSLWDGRSGVLAGDTLRLKVVPSGFSYLTVLSPQIAKDEPALLTRLHEGAVDPNKETVLPVAWRVDDEMRDEILLVVLSQEPLRNELSLDDINIMSRQSPDLWFTHLVLQKSSGSER